MSNEQVSEVLDLMPYGCYIVGSRMESECNGMMADWVMQVSFHPRLVAVSFETDAQTLTNIRESTYFTINFLSQDEDGMILASHFGQPYHASKMGGPEATGVHHKFQGINHTITENGCPILGAAIAWVEARAVSYMPAGDHVLVTGEVLDGRVIREGEPLTSAFTGWNYSG